MPITKLDPVTAFIAIDLQKGIVGLPTAHPTGPVVQHSAALAEAFRHEGLPVVLVNVTGGPAGRTEQQRHMGDLPPDWAEFVPELKRQATDHCVSKKTWGAFTHTGLEQTLRGLGVTQVVIAGVATSIGVESTARQAHELGFNVVLVTDAMTDLTAEAHDNSLARIFPRLGETCTTQEMLHLLTHGRTQ
ncbi:MAG: hydrolase [Rhodospirillales bacterium 20-64-7]|nr:MAG: hydrolase [Rhodospirillales bacterium 20-64-7]